MKQYGCVGERALPNCDERCKCGLLIRWSLVQVQYDLPLPIDRTAIAGTNSSFRVTPGLRTVELVCALHKRPNRGIGYRAAWCQRSWRQSHKNSGKRADLIHARHACRASSTTDRLKSAASRG